MEKPVRPDKTQTTRHSRVSASAQLLHWIASSAGRSHLLLAFRHRSHASWFMLSEPAILLGIWEWTSLDCCVCGEWHYDRPRRLKPQSPASPCFFEDCRLKGKKWMERTEGGYIWASWNTTETETNYRWHVMLDEENKWSNERGDDSQLIESDRNLVMSPPSAAPNLSLTSQGQEINMLEARQIVHCKCRVNGGYLYKRRFIWAGWRVAAWEWKNPWKLPVWRSERICQSSFRGVWNIRQTLETVSAQPSICQACSRFSLRSWSVL